MCKHEFIRDFAKYYIFAIITVIIMVIVIAIRPVYSIPAVNTKYEYIIDNFDKNACWMNICPGKSSRQEAISIIINDKELNIEESSLRGDDINGSFWWFWNSRSHLSLSSIKWEEEKINEIRIALASSRVKLDYFINYYGEPEYIIPIKPKTVDTPSIWVVRIYYPKRGIEIFVSIDLDGDMLLESASVYTVFLYVPMDMTHRIWMEIETGNYDDYLYNIKKWHGYGDLTDY